MVASEFLRKISLPQIYIFCERKQISNERINLAKLAKEDITKWEADNIIPFSGKSACLSGDTHHSCYEQECERETDLQGNIS